MDTASSNAKPKSDSEKKFGNQKPLTETKG